MGTSESAQGAAPESTEFDDVARAMAQEIGGWNGWDSDTPNSGPNGNEPHEERDYWRAVVRFVLDRHSSQRRATETPAGPRYFVSTSGQVEREVSLADYCAAERRAGFRPKLPSTDPAFMTTPATGSFGSGGICGRVEYPRPTAVDPVSQPAVPQFTGIAKQKLAELQADGCNIVGYAIQRPNDGGRYGLITHGGMVGWWTPHAPPLAEQIRAEVIAECCALIKAADDTATRRDYMLDSDDCISVLQGTWADSPKAPAPEEVVPLDFRNADAGRAYIKDFFSSALRNYEYTSYIEQRLAGDFACTLATALQGLRVAAGDVVLLPPHQNVVNALRKERDGWQEEARRSAESLRLTQADLDLRRKHQDRDTWFYQGDGEDHIESMGNGMVVVIHASDLRQLTAATTLTVERLHRALVYVAHRMHGTPIHQLCDGVMLIDGDAVRIKLDGWEVETPRQLALKIRQDNEARWATEDKRGGAA